MTSEIEELCFQGHIVITCECGHFDVMENWVETPIFGELPVDEYQCPACKVAFKKCFGYLERTPARL